MKTSTGVSIFLAFSVAAGAALAATNRNGAGKACSTGDVVNVADGQRSGSAGVLLDEGDLAILRLIATQISPVGSAQQFEVTDAGGEGQTRVVKTQVYTIQTAAGTTTEAQVECEHQGCTDPDCQVEGCDPSGLACTPPKCVRIDNQCGVTTPLGCKKRVIKPASGSTGF